LSEASLTKLVGDIRAKIDTASVFLVGDRSGNNRTWTGSDSFYNQLKNTLKQCNINVADRTNKVNPKVFNTVELVNRDFEQQKLLISPKCVVLIDQLRKCRWKADKFEMDKDFIDGHAVDALRYFVAAITRKVEFAGINISLV
jgi:phage terminase large subunit